MASERQLAANRRNAAKSTGPRSAAGKKRTRGNAHTHGLSSLLSRSATSEAVEVLALQIAGENSNDMILAHARCAAEAEFDLGRARRAKLALIERASAFGSLKLPRFFATDFQEARWAVVMERWMTVRRGRPPKRPIPEDFLATMSPSEPQRTLEAMQRVLPELEKLARYETRRRAAQPGHPPDRWTETVERLKSGASAEAGWIHRRPTSCHIVARDQHSSARIAQRYATICRVKNL